MAFDFRSVFTGSGYNSPNGGRMSFQWLGLAPYVTGQAPNYTSVINGTIKFSEQSNPVTLQTTAWNGFVDGYVENASISGTVSGFVLPSYVAPSPVYPNLPITGRVWWIKILIGTLYYEGRSLISGLDFSTGVDEVVTVDFNFQFIGIPKTTQFYYLAGGNPPQ